MDELILNVEVDVGYVLGDSCGDQGHLVVLEEDDALEEPDVDFGGDSDVVLEEHLVNNMIILGICRSL